MSDEYLNRLAERFCQAPLPADVCADSCASMVDYPHPRMGTNLLTVAQAKEVLRFVLAGELDWQAWAKSERDAQPEGTPEALATCAAMLEEYGADCFPANDQGQVHFARSMMDATASEIRAFLAKEGTAS